MATAQENLNLAIDYEGLAESSAFQHMMKYLQDEVTRLEDIAVLAPASMPDHEARLLMIHWQERKNVLRGIESLLDEQRDTRKLLEEEIANERAVSRARSDRGSW